MLTLAQSLLFVGFLKTSRQAQAEVMLHLYKLSCKRIYQVFVERLNSSYAEGKFLSLPNELASSFCSIGRSVKKL